MIFTIFTPTYNREKLLPQLYESLLKQTIQNFEWVIIDDGSTDKTEDTVRKFISEEKINIKYIKKMNEGKQKTYNMAIDLAQGEYFICIDSDDYYVENGLEIIKYYIEKNQENKRIGAYSYLSIYPNEKLIGTPFPKDEMISNSFDIYYNNNVKGDKGIVFETKILKKFRFPCIEGEKFITEALLYNRISKEYDWVFFNEKIEVKEYQNTGLSKNLDKIIFENPKGYNLYYKELQEHINSFKSFLKVNYSYYLYMIKIKKIKIKELKYKSAIFLYPIFFLNNLRRKF